MKKIGTDFIEESDVDRKINLSLWRALFVLSIVVVILAASLLNLKDGVNVLIKMPPSNNQDNPKHIIYNLNGANVTYYELWGRYLSQTIGNISPDNVNEVIDGLINQMRPSRAIKKLDQANRFKEDIVANRIEQKFTLLDTKLELENGVKISKKATMTITGISEQKVGSRAQERKECAYTFVMEFNEGVFYVEDFGTNCF